MKTRLVLPGGQYGPGLPNDADVEVIGFDYPAEGRNLPAYDRENKEGPYAYFLIRITLPDGQSTLVNHVTNDLNTFGKLLTAMGVEVAQTPEGGIAFDSDDVAPRKLGGIELKEPREAKDGNTYTGNVVRFIAV